MKTLIEIESVEWEQEKQSWTQPVLVHFLASWCGQCRILSPSLEALATELEGELRIAEVNLDYCPELARRYRITDVPALMLFDHGAPVASVDAWMPSPQLKAQVQGLLADYATPGRD